MDAGWHFTRAACGHGGGFLSMPKPFV